MTARNYLCPRYDACLDRAARANKSTLPCQGCEFEHVKEPLDLASDYLGCLKLLWAAYGCGGRFDPEIVFQLVAGRRPSGPIIKNLK